VLYQWGIDRAVDRNRPAQSAGISGANTAITRRALIASGAFDEDVQTGTDYHLARQIHRAGIEIRYVEAPVQTRYAKSASVFLSRRARWLRNTMMHGFRFKDLPEIRSTTITVLLGCGVCFVPLSWRWTRGKGMLAWLLGLSFLIFRRHQYSISLARERSIRLPFGYYCRLPWYVLLDQSVAIRALIDLAFPKRRWRW
jgi:cellulose synthase/poly-beta-1,6-N-acetylglucosamine synthase-like glycosyltransferase